MSDTSVGSGASPNPIQGADSYAGNKTTSNYTETIGNIQGRNKEGQSFVQDRIEAGQRLGNEGVLSARASEPSLLLPSGFQVSLEGEVNNSTGVQEGSTATQNAEAAVTHWHSNVFAVTLFLLITEIQSEYSKMAFQMAMFQANDVKEMQRDIGHTMAELHIAKGELAEKFQNFKAKMMYVQARAAIGGGAMQIGGAGAGMSVSSSRSMAVTQVGSGLSSIVKDGTTAAAQGQTAAAEGEYQAASSDKDAELALTQTSQGMTNDFSQVVKEEEQALIRQINDLLDRLSDAMKRLKDATDMRS